MKYYSDKRIWITGASSGLGRALAEYLISYGARVIITARRSELLNELAAANSRNVFVLPGDMEQIDFVPALCEQAWNRFKGLDLVIMNAGVSQRLSFRNTDSDTFTKIFNINFYSQVEIFRELLPLMEAAGSGHFATVSSLSGKTGAPLRSAYSSAKHALHGLFDSVRVETNIPISMIVPGFINTEISLNAEAGNGQKWNRMDENQSSGMDAGLAAEYILKKLVRKKREIYVGYPPRAALILFLNRFFPGILTFLMKQSHST